MTVRDAATLKSYFVLAKVPVPAYYNDLIDTLFSMGGGGGGHNHDERYVRLSVNNTISAQHIFNPTLAGAPFILGANARGNLVTGLYADQLDKSIFAGSGLSGGGKLINNVTLSVNLRSPSGLSFYEGKLQIDDTIAGSGLTFSGKVLAVGAGDGISVSGTAVSLKTPGTLSVSSINNAANNHTHAITTSSVPGKASSILATDSDGSLHIETLYADSSLYASQIYSAAMSNDIIISPTNMLKLNPTGDISLDPGGNDVVPASAYDINLGAPNAKFLTLHAAELWVETLVAQNTIATIGGRILVGPTTVLAKDLLVTDTTIYVKHNQMAPGDTAYLEADGKVEFIYINTGPFIDGPVYYYTVTRNRDGTGANDWYAGDAVFNTGTVGDGWIDLYSYGSVGGPRLTDIYNCNYNGGSAPIYSADYSSTTSWNMFGDGANTEVNDCIYFGNGLSKFGGTSFYINTAGVYSATLVWEYYTTSLSWSSLTMIETPNLKTTGNKSASWNIPLNWATITINSRSCYWVRLRISAFVSWTTLPNTGIWQASGSAATYGPTIIGNVRTGTVYNLWKEHWAIGNLNALYGYSDNTYGVALGEYDNSNSFITIDSTNGFRVLRRYSNVDTVIGQWATTGAVTIGQVAANQGNVYISSGAISLRNNTTNIIYISSAGVLTIGQTGVGEDNIYMSSGAISIRNNTTERIGLTAAGVLTIKDSTGAAVFTFDSASGAEFTKPLSLATTGGIYQGTGTFISPTTGLKIYNSGGYGKISGYSSGVEQWYAGTDGKLYAAGGAVTLDEYGITIGDTVEPLIAALNFETTTVGHSYGFMLAASDNLLGQGVYEGHVLYVQAENHTTGGTGYNEVAELCLCAHRQDDYNTARPTTYLRLSALNVVNAYTCKAYLYGMAGAMELPVNFGINAVAADDVALAIGDGPIFLENISSTPTYDSTGVTLYSKDNALNVYSPLNRGYSLYNNATLLLTPLSFPIPKALWFVNGSTDYDLTWHHTPLTPTSLNASTYKTPNNIAPLYIADFNGTSSYMSAALATYTHLNSVNWTTFGAWVYIDATGRNHTVMSIGTTTIAWYLVWVNASSNWQFVYYDTGGTGHGCSITTTLTTGWHFVGCELGWSASGSNHMLIRVDTLTNSYDNQAWLGPRSGAGDFRLGNYGSLWLDGKIATAWMAGYMPASVGDSLLEYYNATVGLFKP